MSNVSNARRKYTIYNIKWRYNGMSEMATIGVNQKVEFKVNIGG